MMNCERQLYDQMDCWVSEISHIKLGQKANHKSDYASTNIYRAYVSI